MDGSKLNGDGVKARAAGGNTRRGEWIYRVSLDFKPRKRLLPGRTNHLISVNNA